MLHERGFSGDIPSAARQGLAERTHPDVDGARVDPEMLSDAETARAQHPNGVGFVHHQECAVAALDLDEAVEIRKVTVHAVNSCDDDDGALVLRAFPAQDAIERLPVVVRE